MVKRIAYSILVVLFITVFAILIISYGKGYRINPDEKSLTSTGILSAISTPEAASIWVDGKLKSATNTSLSLPPGWYTVRITKEGYQSWEKKIRVQGEVVSRIEALLIPTNPSLRALTNTGILSPVLSPSGSKVAYIIPDDTASPSSSLKKKTGVWVLDLRSNAFGANSDPRQILKSEAKIDWSNASLLWSPDEKQIMLTQKKKEGKKDKIIRATQISVENSNSSPLDVTFTHENIMADWQNIKARKNEEFMTAVPLTVREILEEKTADIRFSPDETRILYQATASAALSLAVTPPIIGSNPTSEVRQLEPGKYYIYDIKEDKNYFITDLKSIKEPQRLAWYTDSKHILMIENASIHIIDYDGANKRVIYSGPFEDHIVYSWTSPGKVVILTNLNNPKALPNLYEIDLR